MKLTRRGFIEAAVVSLPLKLPVPYGFDASYVPGLLPDFPELPIREVVVFKGASVGCTVAVLENAFAYLDDGVPHVGVRPAPRQLNVAEAAFLEGNYEGEHNWSTKDSNPIDDIKAVWKMIESPEYKAAQRRAYECDKARFARFLEAAGYGPLPPPYGSETS